MTQTGTGDEHGIPSMGGHKISDYLYLTAHSLAGVGDVVECGSWLGASIAPVLRGLNDADSDAEVHCYDQWQATRSEARKAREAGLTINAGDDLLPVFLDNVSGIYPAGLVTHRIDLLDAEWSGEPIELYIDDANKRPELFGHAMRTFGPSFIPNKTILVLMDYEFYQQFDEPKRSDYRCQRDFITSHPDLFERVRDFSGMTGVAFRYTGGHDFESISVGNGHNYQRWVDTVRRGLVLALQGEYHAHARYIKNQYKELYMNYLRPFVNRLYRVSDATRLTGPETAYQDKYYQVRSKPAYLRDARELATAVQEQFSPSSVVDLGCAIGHYLQPYHEHGVTIHGVDAHPSAIEHAVIPREYIELHDLRDPYTPTQQYDAAFCIEVAEHLAPRYARTLINSLTMCAPVVVFTAAPPGQGGTHHVNEQPRDYWKQLFHEQNYTYDNTTTNRLRSELHPVKLTHVPNNLFVFKQSDSDDTV